jgi:CIC family chloride channel protein
MTFLDFKKYFSETKQHYFPVIDHNERLIGIFSSTDIRGILFSRDIEHLVLMKDIGNSDIIVATQSDDLNTVLQKFTTKNIDSLPVVKDDDHQILIGMLNRREVISFYNELIQKMKNKAKK